MYLKVFLVLVSLLFIFSTANAFVDVNITSPGMTDGNYISNNIAGGLVFIDFKYVDSNSANFYPNINGYTLDFNIYYSSTAGTFGNAIITDVNLTHAPDANKTDGGTDTNNYIWVWDTSVITPSDGNYFIDVNVFNNTFKTLGTLTAVDTNSTIISILIDNTNPTATITSATTSSSTFYGLTYTGTDATAGIKKYWVSNNNVDWVDNGTNLSYNLFAGPSGNETAVYYVKSQDFADNNSTAASVNIGGQGGGTPAFCGDATCNFEIGEDTSTCPVDCGAICGDGSCTGTESIATCPADCGPAAACGNGVCESGETPGNCSSDCEPPGQIVKEVVLSQTKGEKPSAQDIIDILAAAGASDTAIEKASEAVGKTSVERNVEVVKETDADEKETFTTTVSITVSNSSDNKLKEIKIVEQIPKSVANDISQIESDFEFTVLLDDPIIEFTVPVLDSGETAEVTYTIAKEVTESQVDEFLPPVTASFSEEEAPSCDNVTCNDNNSCTTDSCFEGQCSFAPKADGTTCGFGQECKSGTCEEISGTTPITPPPTEPAPDYTLVIIIIVIAVIISGFLYYNKKK